MRASVGAMFLALALMATLLCVVCADKRAEMSPAPFVMGSRYGRSPHRLVSPRNDRFFMGSRYGKRSEGRSEGRLEGRLESASGAEGWSGSRELLCEFTGVFPLYRCARRDHSRLERRSSSDESVPGDSE